MSNKHRNLTETRKAWRKRSRKLLNFIEELDLMEKTQVIQEMKRAVESLKELEMYSDIILDKPEHTRKELMLQFAGIVKEFPKAVLPDALYKAKMPEDI